MSATNDRWVNWERIPHGEDFWDMIEDIDKKRLLEIREEKQMADLRRKSEINLDKKFTPEFIAKGVETDPYFAQINYTANKKKEVS